MGPKWDMGRIRSSDRRHITDKRTRTEHDNCESKEAARHDGLP